MPKPSVLVILGPTASGKTDYAISLAKERNGEIISADSRQLYVGMNIGTAKPQSVWETNIHEILKADEIEGVPHYLFNVASPDQPWTLSQWQAAAKHVIQDIGQRGKQPIIVGGTMLYVDSVVFNYTIPQVTPNEQFRNQLEAEPVETLYNRLIQADPAAKEFIEPHHKRRIIRALEVIEQTGKPFSASRQRSASPYQFELVGLFPGWEVLQERITHRIQTMFQEGLVEETRQLRKRYTSALPLLQTMNYKQAGNVLDGLQSEDEAIQEAIRANMKYAHRQMAWWKHREEIGWI